VFLVTSFSVVAVCTMERVATNLPKLRFRVLLFAISWWPCALRESVAFTCLRERLVFVLYRQLVIGEVAGLVPSVFSNHAWCKNPANCVRFSDFL